MATARFTTLRYLVVLVFVFLTSTTKPCASQSRLACLPRQYRTYDAVKEGCRTQQITIYGCHGRCHTYEVPSLSAPYKESFHVMCSYERTVTRVVRLDDCDPGVDPTFEYEDALSCACKNCNEGNTYCQGF